MTASREETASFAVWLRSLVPAEVEMVFFEINGGSDFVPLPGGAEERQTWDAVLSHLAGVEPPLTEKRWLTTAEPADMVRFLQTNASERRLRLLACAFALGFGLPLRAREMTAPEAITEPALEMAGAGA